MSKLITNRSKLKFFISIDLFKVFKLKLIPLRSKFDTFKIKIEKCPKTGRKREKTCEVNTRAN